jgi:hypothetical protein
LKKKVRIKFTPAPSKTEGTISKNTNNQKERMKKAQEEAINSPAVKEILDTFGGKIVDVKINQ